MRSTKLIGALVATALAVTPAAASAVVKHRPLDRRARPTAGCHITLFAEPHVITSGESVQLFGQLRCPAIADTSGQSVTLLQRVGRPRSGERVAATLPTGTAGFYSIVIPSVTTNTYFSVRAAGARSGIKAVKVAPVVKLEGPRETRALLTGARNLVTFTGTVSPAAAGAVVALQREDATSNEEWRTIQLGVVGAGGSFTIVHKFSIPGDANIRVVVRPHPPFTVRGVSNTLSYVISQRQNPNLTLNASADPVPFGTPVILSGVVKGGANQPVTLWSHPRGTQAFTVADKTTANGSGEYKFTIPAAARNAAYRVTSGALKSAILYEGVRYVLTAAASTATVPSGQPVTFSGTVAPVHVGHVVYLERENPFGGGFHVVDIGTVAANGTYAIAHYLFGAGKQVYRVKVPGDPENQAVSSTPFTIEVTPAPPASLRPVTPSRQPR
jgi:hypothetical protein